MQNISISAQTKTFRTEFKINIKEHTLLRRRKQAAVFPSRQCCRRLLGSDLSVGVAEAASL